MKSMGMMAIVCLVVACAGPDDAGPEPEPQPKPAGTEMAPSCGEASGRCAELCFGECRGGTCDATDASGNCAGRCESGECFGACCTHP